MCHLSVNQNKSYRDKGLTHLALEPAISRSILSA